MKTDNAAAEFAIVNINLEFSAKEALEAFNKLNVELQKIIDQQENDKSFVEKISETLKQLFAK